MRTDEKLSEAEADLDQLIHRAECAMPTLRRAVEDVTDWRRDIRKELLANLENALKRARENQQKRRSSWSPGDHMLERFMKKGLAAQGAVDETLGREAARPESEGKDEASQAKP